MTGINGRPGRSRDIETSPLSLSPTPEKWSFVYPPTGFLYISQRCHSSLVPHLLFTSAALKILIGRTAIIFIHSCFNTGSIFRFVIAMFVSEVRFFLRKSKHNLNFFEFDSNFFFNFSCIDFVLFYNILSYYYIKKYTCMHLNIFHPRFLSITLG